MKVKCQLRYQTNAILHNYQLYMITQLIFLGKMRAHQKVNDIREFQPLR